MHISEVNIYPIKSLKGISLDSAKVEERGLQYDRRWMLTNTDGRFMTQREFPKMATICVELADRELIVSTKEWGGMAFPMAAGTGDVRDVTIWQSVCPGEVYSSRVNEWFSMVLETECQLVYMPDESRRNVNPRFNQNDDVVSFADGYPLLIISEASLGELNSRLDEPLPMNRFRPNLVVSGSSAFAEDNWKRIKVGDAIFRSTKPSERCVITTVDQAGGEFAGREPLKTLASYRTAGNVLPDRYESLGIGASAVLFGQNLIAESVGRMVRVGDVVEVLF